MTDLFNIARRIRKYISHLYTNCMLCSEFIAPLIVCVCVKMFSNTNNFMNEINKNCIPYIIVIVCYFIRSRDINCHFRFTDSTDTVSALYLFLELKNIKVNPLNW